MFLFEERERERKRVRERVRERERASERERGEGGIYNIYCFEPVCKQPFNRSANIIFFHFFILARKSHSSLTLSNLMYASAVMLAVSGIKKTSPPVTKVNTIFIGHCFPASARKPSQVFPCSPAKNL